MLFGDAKTTCDGKFNSCMRKYVGQFTDLIGSQQLNKCWATERKQECMCKIFFNYRDFNALAHCTSLILDLVTTGDSRIRSMSFIWPIIPRSEAGFTIAR